MRGRLPTLPTLGRWRAPAPPPPSFVLILDGDNLILGQGTLTLTGDNLELTNG